MIHTTKQFIFDSYKQNCFARESERASREKSLTVGTPWAVPALVLVLVVYLCSLHLHVPDVRSYDCFEAAGTSALCLVRTNPGDKGAEIVGVFSGHWDLVYL